MSTKPTLTCQLCQSPLTKHQAQFVDEDTFSFSTQPPAIPIGAFCFQCYDQQVAPAVDHYNELLERAKNVNVFFLSQSKESRFVRRIEKPIKVTDCPDREETLLRLAFMAIELGKNSLVDVDLSSVKVRIHSRQTSSWSGRGIPADIDDRDLQRKFLGSPN